METTTKPKKASKKKKRTKKKQLDEDEERMKLEKEEEDKEKKLLVNSIMTKCNLSEEKVTILNSGQNFILHNNPLFKQECNAICCQNMSNFCHPRHWMRSFKAFELTSLIY